ncbi:NAD(P)-dependent oxidoreductase [Nocardia flavorosea]|uniref:NAD(P)-dependent oxidoreductase n=1 Tax=Nocardia flavorosea TaxID=53429 RepID=A0A846YI95_9NOCA|nr:NAD(P)-dependent oxidoreductase [Nocardia flavorosea]NKY57551.1 NAD(P)-dependent oxidoreductase [Nocardia flavorosea]
MRIGFVGAGRMGTPMIRRLVTAGHSVRALGRNPAAREAIGGAGATAVGSAAEAGRDADAVVICVFTDEQVRDVCLGSGLLETMPRDSVLILHTTGNPDTATAIAAAATGRRVVDAPVSGGPHNIADGTITVFLGGDTEAVERARPVLSAYADPVLPVGALGNGQRVKLVNNALFAAQIGLVTEAVRLAGQLGLAESEVLTALPHASSSSRAVLSVAAKGSVAAFAESVGDFLRKDVAVARDLADRLGSDLGLLDPAIRAAVGPA